MAVIKNNKTGMWEVRTYYKDLTGERKQKTKRGFAKKSEALEWERKFKLKEDQTISKSYKRFVDIYLIDIQQRRKRNTKLKQILFRQSITLMRKSFCLISGNENWIIFGPRMSSSGRMRL